jgi:hypothetical protein
MKICPCLLHISYNSVFHNNILRRIVGPVKTGAVTAVVCVRGVSEFLFALPTWAKLVRNTHIHLFGFVSFEKKRAVEAVLL